LIGSDGSGLVRVAHPASDSKPLFAPDGSGVVFQSDRKGGDLWFLPISDGRPAGDARPVWGELGPFGQADQFAQNGSLIYFYSTTGWEIYSAEFDLKRGFIGAPEHLAPLRGEINNAPAFSPDGKFLAHLRDGGRRLVLRDLANGAEREFPVDGFLTVPGIDFCPDGRTVIIAGAASGERTAYRVNLDRGGAERVRIPASRAVCAAESGDIVYLRALGQGRFDVVRRSLAAGTEITLHAGSAHELSLARSPDAGKVAFVDVRADEARLIVMPSTGGQAVTVASSPLKEIGGRTGHEFQGFMWLPAEDGLLVARDAGGSEASPEVTLWRVLLDGTPAAAVGRMRLPAYQGGFAGSGHYTLHPNGSHIAFERHAGVVSQLWAIDNLAQFIKSGRSVAVPYDPRSR
jgi:dipeptidyl aminopeptidase/acylaminoacyl peptidase